jgi:hypothetical protein
MRPLPRTSAPKESRQQGGLKERQTLYGGGGIECPLYRDGGAIGVSGDMRPGNPEVSEQCATISGLLRYGERDTGTAAPGAFDHDRRQLDG